MPQTPQTQVVPIWAPQVRKIHIRNVIIISLVLVMIAVIIILGFIYPKCNPTQIHGFYSCKCPPDSAMNPQTKLCTCLSNGSQIALDDSCVTGSGDQRTLFGALDPASQTMSWIYTNNAAYPSS